MINDKLNMPFDFKKLFDIDFNSLPKFNFRKPKVIYISHIKQDKLAAYEVKVNLIMLGYQVVTTPIEKSERELVRLSDKLVDHADAVIVLKSPSASRSPHIWQDIAQARLHETPVIPMVVHQFDGKVPVHHHIDAVDDFEVGFRKLREALSERKHHFNNNELDYTPRKGLLRKTVVPVAVMILTFIAGLLP